jgi:hypothetical protein
LGGRKGREEIAFPPEARGSAEEISLPPGAGDSARGFGEEAADKGNLLQLHHLIRNRILILISSESPTHARLFREEVPG